MNGNSSIVPTESLTSVSTWAAKPSRYPTVNARLRFHSQNPAATATPRKSVWVKPIPGQPRCHWCGSSEP